MKAAMRPPEAIILDVLLPDGRGTDVCRELRSWSDGADPRALGRRRGAGEDRGARRRRRRLRHEAVQRRRAARAAARGASPNARRPAQPVIEVGDLRIDLGQAARDDGRRAGLAHADRVRPAPAARRERGQAASPTRRSCARSGGRRTREESNYLHVYVSHLRRKIEPDPARPRYILNQPGVGYRLVAPDRLKTAFRRLRRYRRGMSCRRLLGAHLGRAATRESRGRSRAARWRPSAAAELTARVRDRDLATAAARRAYGRGRGCCPHALCIAPRRSRTRFGVHLRARKVRAREAGPAIVESGRGARCGDRRDRSDSQAPRTTGVPASARPCDRCSRRRRARCWLPRRRRPSPRACAGAARARPPCRACRSGCRTSATGRTTGSRARTGSRRSASRCPRPSPRTPRSRAR